VGRGILAKIKSVLRTEWIVSEVKEWIPILGIMHPLHAELTKPYWWQDVGIPTPITITDGAVTPLNAQMYQLLKRKCLAAIQSAA
jgi:hypothetical protein